MTQAVTELIVKGDGALATLDRFEDKMGAAGVAAERAASATDEMSRAASQGVGAVARYEAASAKLRAQMESGNAVSTVRVARISAEQRAFERLASSADATYALRVRQDREAQRAAVDATNAVVMGYATQEQALTALMAVERRHAEQLQAVTDQHQRAAQAATNHAAANDNLAMSSTRAAASSGGGSMNTANIAAQFQDIGVTAAMGMSPMMIALQQGTQLSSVLNSMQSPIRGLAAAFVTLINPVSLLTIGFVALAAAAVQWFMSAASANDNATNSLEAHRQKLDEVLKGYEATKQAALDVLDAQAAAPEASVLSDLSVFREDALERYETTLERVTQKQAELQDIVNSTMQTGAADSALLTQMQRVLDIVTETGVSTSTTRAELEGLHTSLTLIKNTSADDNIAYFAEALLDMINQAMEGKAAVDSLDASLRNLPRNITINLRIQQNVEAATDAAISGIERLKQLAPELRSAREQASDALAQALTAPDDILRKAGQVQYDATIAALDEQDRRRAEAEASGGRGGGAGGGGGSTNTYADMIRQSQEFIAAKQMEAEALGMTGAAAAAYRHEQQMLTQAANDNIALSPVQREEIAMLAESMAQAEMAMAGVQFALGNPDPWQQAMDNIANLDAALANGSLSWEQYGAAAFKANAGAASAVLGLAGGFTGALSQMFQDNKAFAVANAVVSTAEAVMKALSIYGPTPWGFAAAGVAAATGAAQIVSILSAQKGSSSVSKPGAGTLPGAAERPAAEAARATQINVTLGGSGRYSRDEVRDLLEQLTDGMSDNVDGGQFKLAVQSK